MFPASLFTWWYSTGWRDQVALCSARLSRVSDFFSLSLLLRSFFAPFRQISAETVRGGLDVVFRAWLDRLISRGIGAMIRSTLIITGILLLALECLISFLRLACWPLIPLLPIAGIILSLSGWIPWQ